MTEQSADETGKLEAAFFIPFEGRKTAGERGGPPPGSYVTKDDSDIVEIFHPGRMSGPGLPCSLAEATVHAGKRTIPHVHERSTEIYYFLSGRGDLVLGEESHAVFPGAAALIPPLTRHWVEAKETLRFLCVCCPPYDHAQTVLDEE